MPVSKGMFWPCTDLFSAGVMGVGITGAAYGCTVGLMSRHNAVILHLSSEFPQISASLACLLGRVVLCICSREASENPVAMSTSCQADQFVDSSIDLLGSVTSEFCWSIAGAEQCIHFLNKQSSMVLSFVLVLHRKNKIITLLKKQWQHSMFLS